MPRAAPGCAAIYCGLCPVKSRSCSSRARVIPPVCYVSLMNTFHVKDFEFEIQRMLSYSDVITQTSSYISCSYLIPVGDYMKHIPNPATGQPAEIRGKNRPDILSVEMACRIRNVEITELVLVH